ncbi:hypothetical protein PMIT1306_00008 [Prochlorococcus sp. MIT 1306]|nr:hypothetical protein PMIT1306_00008 [Prochlorococcus sp. MIT 1306]
MQLIETVCLQCDCFVCLPSILDFLAIGVSMELCFGRIRWLISPGLIDAFALTFYGS